MARKVTPQGEDLKEKQRYVQGYLQVVGNLYGRGQFSQEQARIAERAWKRRLPPSAFVTLIRREDPAYPRTKDFSQRLREAKGVWGSIRPGRPMPSEFSTNYVHSGLSTTQLMSRIQYGMQKKPLMPVSTNANAYRTLRSLLNDSFRKRIGAEAPDLLHNMVFSSKLQDNHIDEQYHDLFGGKDVFKWMDPKSQIPEMPRGPQIASPGASSGFLSHMQNQFGIDATKGR